MAIVGIFSGSFCHGEEIADKAATRLNYERIEQRLLEQTSRSYDVDVDKLIRSMTGKAPFLNRLTREREKNIAYLKVTLAELIQLDKRLLFGHATHLLPSTVPHILKVCVIANHDYRVAQAMEVNRISEKDASRLIHKNDEELLEWTRYLFEKTPYDASLYDMVIPMHDTSVDEAIDLIYDNALSHPLQTTARSQRAAEDFIVAANVNLALVEAGHDLDVTAVDGQVTLTINHYVSRLKQYQDEVKKIAAGVSGAREIETKIGPRYKEPSINPLSNVEVPPKILLVDDEKEFVHTLSERLQTRNLESSVVYDGEQALDFVKKDEPDVMVLDLMMPGIDGIEVLRRVKREHPQVEVIILTGHGSDRERILAEELGAFAYLEKPVSIDVLAKTMNEAYQRVNKAKAALRRERDVTDERHGE